MNALVGMACFWTTRLSYITSSRYVTDWSRSVSEGTSSVKA